MLCLYLPPLVPRRTHTISCGDPLERGYFHGDDGGGLCGAHDDVVVLLLMLLLLLWLLLVALVVVVVVVWGVVVVSERTQSIVCVMVCDPSQCR